MLAGHKQGANAYTVDPRLDFGPESLNSVDKLFDVGPSLLFPPLSNSETSQLDPTERLHRAT